jgi:hypothetical protein
MICNILLFSSTPHKQTFYYLLLYYHVDLTYFHSDLLLLLLLLLLLFNISKLLSFIPPTANNSPYFSQHIDDGHLLCFNKFGKFIIIYFITNIIIIFTIILTSYTIYITFLICHYYIQHNMMDHLQYIGNIHFAIIHFSFFVNVKT